MKARIWFPFCHQLLGRIFSPLWTKSPPVIENYAIYSQLSLNTTAIAKMTVYLVSYWFISAGTTTSAQSSFRTCITAYRCHSLTATTTTCASKWADTTNWNIRNKLPSVSDNKKTKQQKQSILLFELYCIFWNHLFLRNKINSNLRVYDVPLFVHFLFWFCFAVFCLFSIWLLLAARCTRYDHLHFIVQLKISPLCAVIAMPKMHCIIIN